MLDKDWVFDGRKRMKTNRIGTVLLMSVVFIFTSIPANAVEFMYRGNRGYEHYSCGSNRRGGFVKIKQISPTRFRIYSKRMSGDFEISPQTVEKAWCLGPVGAARIVCGFCKVSLDGIRVSTDD